MSLKYIDSFLEMLTAERGASKNTINSYRTDLIDVLNFFNTKGIDIKKAKHTDLKSYISLIEQNALSSKTQNRRLCAIREFYRFLYSEDLIKKSCRLSAIPKNKKIFTQILNRTRNPSAYQLRFQKKFENSSSS